METISVYDLQGNTKSTLSLESVISKKEVSNITFSCAIRALLQNWRQGTVSCKGRGDVAFSGKKPWKQKGTGRARAGMISSPLWRKGGVIFGPQPRVRTLKFSNKKKALVFNNIFFEKLSSGNIKCLDFENALISPNTKMAMKALKSIESNNKNVALFLNYDDSLNFMSFRNIPNINILFFDNPNAFDLANGHQWFFLKKDFDSFKKMVSQWN